ncbi:MAG TPA: PIN domain-containing protein [Thermofilaceae archaeon]|nr:MAG: VapC toxin family PIN domain ribonuclease [Thermoprotei archaeon]HDD33857.1 PIN domain-containing protein [Thermofilaceae archaeon]
MIVVDASALAAFILQEPGWESLASYLKHCCSVDHVVKEVANAVWRAVRRRLISVEDAVRKVELMLKLVDTNVVLFNELNLLGRAFEISLSHGITVYDALYIALAEREGSLLSLDSRQREVAKQLGVELVEVEV